MTELEQKIKKTAQTYIDEFYKNKEKYLKWIKERNYSNANIFRIVYEFERAKDVLVYNIELDKFIAVEYPVGIGAPLKGLGNTAIFENFEIRTIKL